MRKLHADMILEWAMTGKQVQFFDEYNGMWRDTDNPTWCVSLQYRFKPEVVKYKRYIARASDGIVKVFNAHPKGVGAGICPSERPHFIRWVDTEWQEVVV